MKKIKSFFLLVPLLATSLLACAPNISSSSAPSTSEATSEATSESTSEATSQLPIKDYIFDFYSVNDFHGHISAVKEITKDLPGISTLSRTLKDEKAKNEEGYVFINAGDMYQETYESFVSRGQLVSKMFDYMECEAAAVGNHEFDWGIDALQANREPLGNCRLLGTNVYHYNEETGEVGDFASEYFEPYKIIERQGFKIGILGVIGQSQITSITSTLTKGLTFIKPDDVVLDLAKDLKENHDCKMVIMGAHAGFSDLGGRSFAKKATVEYKPGVKYIDGVFLGHRHIEETFVYNDVPFIQCYPYGTQIAHFGLSYNNGTNKVKLLTPRDEMHINVKYNPEYKDPGMDKIIEENLNDDYKLMANEEIGGFSDVNYKKEISKQQSGRLLNFVTYEALKDKFPNLVLVGNNGGRSDVYTKDDGRLTREQVFNMIPFTNWTYVTDIKGSDLISQFVNGGYNTYYVPHPFDIDKDKTYQVALIDYILFHQDRNRNLDRFPSFTKTWDYVLDTVSHELVVNYLLKNTVSLNFIDNDPGFTGLTGNY